MIIDKYPELFKMVNDPEMPLVYNEKFREFGIKVLDGGTSFIQINFCPFSGIKLPKNLRDEWFDVVESLGLEPDDSDMPEELKSGKWWMKNIK